VTGDYLKLTTYFGERLRHRHGFVADTLLDLYGNHNVATSVMLRGIASFGPRHQLRSDELLSLSEDPPVAIAAVDTADKIAALAEQAVTLTTRGLITLERAHLVGPGSAVRAIPETAKLTVYVGRQHRVAGAPAYRAVCAALHRHGFAGATVFLGVDGTAHGQRRRARFFSRNADVPLMIVAVGTGDQVGAVLDELDELLERPLCTVERAQLCKRDGELLARPATLPATDDRGRMLWQKLMIHTSEAALHDGVPIHRAIVRRLLDSGVSSGATVLRGVWGYSGDAQPHGDRLFQLGRQVPVTTVVVDTPARIAASFDVVDQLTAGHGMISAEMVPAAVIVDAGVRHGSTILARHSY
jgi:PII-like signaling protein